MGASVLCSCSNLLLDELVHCCQLPVLRHLVATRLAAQPKLQQGSNKENHVWLKQLSRCASNRTITQPGSFSPFARLWTLVHSAFTGRVNTASHEASTSNAELVYRSSTVQNFKETATGAPRVASHVRPPTESEDRSTEGIFTPKTSETVLQKVSSIF